MKRVQLIAGGDIALGGALAGLSTDALATRAAGAGELFRRGDVSIVSLDCAIGRVGEPPDPEEYVVDAPEENLDLLKHLGIGVVSLANNHSTDRGFEALGGARRALARRGLEAVGGGATYDEACQPLIVVANGMRLGILAFAATDPWVGALQATSGRGGVAPLVEASATAAIADMAPTVDAVIVCVHWGKEYMPLPPPEIVRLGRSLIDAGARVVLGTHPHVMQPLETYQGGVICYSLGNLLFPAYPEQGLDFSGDGLLSMVVAIEIGTETAFVKGTTVVSFDEAGFLSCVPAPAAQALLDDLTAKAPELGTVEHERLWRQAVRKHEMQRLRRVLREEVLAAGWRGGTARLLRLGRKNIVSVGRSLREILLTGKSCG
jgi:hypothetical protein